MELSRQAAKGIRAVPQPVALGADGDRGCRCDRLRVLVDREVSRDRVTHGADHSFGSGWSLCVAGSSDGSVLVDTATSFLGSTWHCAVARKLSEPDACQANENHPPDSEPARASAFASGRERENVDLRGGKRRGFRPAGILASRLVSCRAGRADRPDACLISFTSGFLKSGCSARRPFSRLTFFDSHTRPFRAFSHA